MEETTDLLENKMEEGKSTLEEDNDRQIFMNRLRVLGFAKNIKFWTVIEILYNCFIGFFYFWPYLLCSMVPVIGYYGSKNFNKKYIGFYFSGEILKLIFQLFVLIFISSVTSKVITSIIMIMSLVYINTIWKFYKNLCNISERDLHCLKNGWSPRIVYFVY